MKRDDSLSDSKLSDGKLNRGRRYKILIIDDSAADRRIYRRFLEGQTQYDLEIVEAPTAQLGLDLCATLTPDCVILDYRLPDLDGLEVLENLQGKTRMPVLFITGKPEALLMGEAYRRGAVKYLSKDTVTSASILEALTDALELN